MVSSLIDRLLLPRVAIIASRCDYIRKGGRSIWVNLYRNSMSAIGPLTPNSGQHHASCGSPPVDLDGLFASLCRNFFATCCLLRHSGLLSFIFWPVGNDCTDELVQK